MNVTVVVSGLPNKVSLKELAYNFDKLFNTDDVGTFRLRDISNEDETRLVALDFENGFSAMTVQLMLDGFQYKLRNGEECKLKCKISKNKKHLQLAPIAYNHNDTHDHYSKSVVRFNEDMIEKQNSNIDAQLKLLEKKRLLVEAERELVKAKKKLKKEYCKVDSDSEDSSGSQKYTKKPKSSKSQKRKSESRDRYSSYSPPSKYLNTYTKSRHKSKSRSSSRSRKSPSISRSINSHVAYPSSSKGSSIRMRSPKTSKSYDDYSSYNFASKRSPSQSRRSSNRETSVVLYESRKKPYSPLSSSKKYDDTSYSYKTSPSFERSPSSLRRLSYKEKSSSYRKSPGRSRESPYSRHRSPTRTSPSYYRNTRDRSRASPLDARGYNDDTYSRIKYDNYDAKKTQSTYNTLPNKIKSAIKGVIAEIENLIQSELKSLSINDVNIVTNVFEDYVKNGFRQLNNFADHMTVSEIIKNYRLNHTTEEDKRFFIKLINELKPFDTKKSNEKKDNISKPQMDVWDDIDEVLQEIPTEILQDNNDNRVANKNDSEILIKNMSEDVLRIHVDLKINPDSNHSKAANSDADSDNRSKKSKTSDCFNKYIPEYKNISVQHKIPKKMDNTLSSIIMIDSDEEEIVPNKQDIEELQVVMDNILKDYTDKKSVLENKISDKIENDVQAIVQTDKVVPNKPQFIIPIKKLTTQMKLLLKLNSECKDLPNITQMVLKERLRILLLEKEHMKSAQIVALYRSHYPKENDKLFIKCIIEIINSGKYHELCEKKL